MQTLLPGSCCWKAKCIFNRVTNFKPFVVDRVELTEGKMLRPTIEITMRARENGGCLWRYSADLTMQEGTTAWVQPPGNKRFQPDAAPEPVPAGHERTVGQGRAFARADLKTQLAVLRWLRVSSYCGATCRLSSF